MAREEPEKSKILIKCENQAIAMIVREKIERESGIKVAMYSMHDDGLFLMVADMRINEDYPDVMIVYDSVNGERMDMWLYILKGLGDKYEIYDWTRQGETPDRMLTEKHNKEIKVSDIEHEGYMSGKDRDILIEDHKPRKIEKMIEQCQDMYIQEIINKMYHIDHLLAITPLGSVSNTAMTLADMAIRKMKEIQKKKDN